MSAAGTRMPVWGVRAMLYGLQPFSDSTVTDLRGRFRLYGAPGGSGHGTGRIYVTLKQVSEVLSIGSARKNLERCRLGVHMHGPSWSGRSGTAVGGPDSPHSDSVFRSNTSTTDLKNPLDVTGWRRGVVHLHSPLPARSRQAGATIRRGRPFAAGEPRHLQRHREHLAAAKIHTPLGRQARRRCSIPQRYFSMAVP